MDTKGGLFGYKVAFTVPSIELSIQSKMFFLVKYKKEVYQNTDQQQ